MTSPSHGRGQIGQEEGVQGAELPLAGRAVSTSNCSPLRPLLLPCPQVLGPAGPGTRWSWAVNDLRFSITVW